MYNISKNKIIDKLILTFATSILFIVLASPNMFKITGGKTHKRGFDTSSEDGRPYASGIAIHSFIFFLFMFLMLLDNLLVAIPSILVLIGLIVVL
jgi:hypothetical protein